MISHIIVRLLTVTDIPMLALMVERAFQGRDGSVPDHYRSAAVGDRLRRSLDSDVVTLVADLSGVPAALGQYGPARWARSTWELMLGATWPVLQGCGLGHALAVARLEAVAAEGGGMVFVSTRQPARWRRYGFDPGPNNPVTGATALWRFIPGLSACAEMHVHGSRNKPVQGGNAISLGEVVP